MPVFHYLSLRTFVHETEDPDRVRRALRHAAHARDVEPEETVAEGSHGNRIRILEAEVRSAKAERELFAALARDDPAGYARVLDEARKRVDEHLNFFVRLDKQAAYAERTVLATDDDAITVRARLRSFPTPGENAEVLALQALQAFLLRCKEPKSTSHS